MPDRVFFLGAGFSKALNASYPTLSELTTKVDERFCRRYEVGPLRVHYDQIAPPLRRDIEQLLSYLATNWPWKTSVDEGLDQALFDALTFEVAQAIRTIPESQVAPQHIRLLGYLNEHAFGIVSLNYDTLFEDLSRKWVLAKRGTFSALEIWIEDDFDHERKTSASTPYVVEQKNPPDDSNSPPLRSRLTISREFLQSVSPELFSAVVQSTGAATWTTWPPGNVLAKIKDYCNRDLVSINNMAKLTTPLKLHGSIDWTSDKSQTVSVLTGLRGNVKQQIPLIVPPIADKSGYYASAKLRDLWFDAHSKIERAREVVLIGFSLPPTDISVRYLFQSALRSNPGVKIVVVNTDGSHELRARYEAVFAQVKEAGNLDFYLTGRPSVLDDFIATCIPG